MPRFLAVFVLGLLASGGICTAQDKFQIKGFVRELDVKLGTITIDIPKSGAQSYSLASADLPIRDARGDAMKLQDVKPGRKVTLSIARATDVAAIAVAPSFKVGTIVSVNRDTRELELLVKKEKLRFKLAKDAHYYRSERIVAPLELRPGHRITAYYLPESNEVIVVNYRDLDS
jgi:hypothetical protein